MGSVWSVLPASLQYDLDIPDPVTGLSNRDKEEIKESWQIVKKDLKSAGTKFFIKLFIEYPSFQKLFPAFSDVSLSEFPNNKKVTAHGTIVMYTLSSMIDNLEDPECLAVLVRNVAQNHYNRGVTYEHFSKIESIMISLFEEQLGRSLSLPVQEAWHKLLSVLVSVAKDVAEKNQTEIS